MDIGSPIHRLRVLILGIATAVLGIVVAVLSLAMPRDDRPSRGGAGTAPIGDAAGDTTVLRSLDVATDPRARACPGATDPANVLAAVELARGADYRTAFPKMGLSPELEALRMPVAMVVYADGYRGFIWVAPDTPPREDREPEPGTVDICAVISSDERVLYLDVPLEGFAVP